MNHIRRHPISGEEILYVDHSTKPIGYRSGECPFCEIGEHKFLSIAIEDDEISLWENKYPVVPDSGYQELIVESKRHDANLRDLSDAHLLRLLEVIQDRIRYIYREKDARYVAFFRNYGLGSGGTQPHPHSQLYGLSFLPPQVQKEMVRMNEVFRTTGRCILCEMVEHEEGIRERTLFENEGAIAWVPSASPNPMEIWVSTKKHFGAFPDVKNSDLLMFHDVFRQTVRLFETRIGGAPYNILLFSFPEGEGTHFRFIFFPRLFPYSGFVMGNGTYINSIWPERVIDLLKGSGEGWRTTR
jgi:UDPglucose--hexose-1-phosphate uridylyltransferase